MKLASLKRFTRILYIFVKHDLARFEVGIHMPSQKMCKSTVRVSWEPLETTQSVLFVSYLYGFLSCLGYQFLFSFIFDILYIAKSIAKSLRKMLGILHEHTHVNDKVIISMS